MKRTYPLAASLSLTLVASGAFAAFQPPPYLVRDIGDESWQVSDIDYFDSPDFFAAGDGVAYFFQDDGVHGRELWRTDGTAVGTGLAADIEPGPASSSPETMPLPRLAPANARPQSTIGENPRTSSSSVAARPHVNAASIGRSSRTAGTESGANHAWVAMCR